MINYFDWFYEGQEMKKWIIVALLWANATVSNALETIVIGALPVPNAEILKIAKPLLAKQGYNLEIKEYTDYITPNKALSQKQLDANFFSASAVFNAIQ